MVKLSDKSKAVLKTTEIYRDTISKFMTDDVEVMKNNEKFTTEFINGYAMAVQSVQEGIYRALAEIIVTQIPDKQVSEIYVPENIAEIIQKAQWQHLLPEEEYGKIDLDKIIKQVNKKKEGK